MDLLAIIFILLVIIKIITLVFLLYTTEDFPEKNLWIISTGLSVIFNLMVLSLVIKERLQFQGA